LCRKHGVVSSLHNPHVKVDAFPKGSSRCVDVGRKNVGGDNARHAAFGEKRDEREPHVAEALHSNRLAVK